MIMIEEIEVRPEETPSPEPEKAKADREVWPVRIITIDADGSMRLVPEAGTFTRQEAAWRWVEAKGDGGLTYLPARMPAFARKCNPRAFTDVPLPFGGKP
jgi:hypothetical protein